MVSRVCAAYEVHDGTCDQCDHDKAPLADQVCRECGFYYCRRHADAHQWRFPSHHLRPYKPGPQARASGARASRTGKEAVAAKGQRQRQVESLLGLCESRRGSETCEESEEGSEPGRQTEEDYYWECGAEGKPEAESRFDRKIAMGSKSVSKRKCSDFGLDLSPYFEKDRPIICVLGAAQSHQLYTIDEAFEELISKDSIRVKAALIELVEKLKLKSSDPTVTSEEMKVFVQQEFKKVQEVVAEEEHKVVHLVDLEEAKQRGELTEILADMQSLKDRGTTQRLQAKEQLDTASKSAKPKKKSA